MNKTLIDNDQTFQVRKVSSLARRANGGFATPSRTWAPIICLGLLLAAPVHAGFNLDWWSFGGPAGQSTGGAWAVSGAGAVGAGTAAGGPYILTGGFWSLLGTVPAPGAPRLAVARAGNSARISWPRSAEAFTLEETPTLTGTPQIPWTASAYPRETNATHISVTVPMPGGARYFRLHQP